MTLEITSHHIIELIKEDIKLTHLVYGLQDLGLESSAELCNLSLPIFKLCGMDLTKDMIRVEAYYGLVNSTMMFSIIYYISHNISYTKKNWVIYSVFKDSCSN